MERCSGVGDFQLIHKHKGPLCGPVTTLIHSLSQFLSCQPSQIPPTSPGRLSSTADECIKCSVRRKRSPQPPPPLVVGGFCLRWTASQLTAPLKNERQRLTQISARLLASVEAGASSARLTDAPCPRVFPSSSREAHSQRSVHTGSDSLTNP